MQHREKYIEQLKFTTVRIEAVIDKIIRSDSSAIIILQSDHGEWNVDTLPQLHDYTNDTSFISQRMPILNAYRVPIAIREVLYDSISPVNSFRIVLDKLGYKKEPVIPDKHFVVWWTTKKKNVKVEN